MSWSLSNVITFKFHQIYFNKISSTNTNKSRSYWLIYFKFKVSHQTSKSLPAVIEQTHSRVTNKLQHYNYIATLLPLFPLPLTHTFTPLKTTFPSNALKARSLVDSDARVRPIRRWHWRLSILRASDTRGPKATSNRSDNTNCLHPDSATKSATGRDRWTRKLPVATVVNWHQVTERCHVWRGAVLPEFWNFWFLIF